MRTSLKRQTKQEQEQFSLIIQTLKKGSVIDGFISQVINKKTKGSMFEYAITEKDAREKADTLLKMTTMLTSKLSPLKDEEYFINILPIKLKKCDIVYCDRLCEQDERYCLKCEDLYYDAMIENARHTKGDDVV